MIQELALLQQAAGQPSPPPDPWSPLLVALTPAVIGVLAGWLGAYLKIKAENYATKQDFDEALGRLAANTRTVGEEQARIARGTALDAELREAVRQFAVAAGGMIHSMCWLTWDCIERGRVNAKMVTDYDQEAHKLLPTIVAQLAVIAMLNRDVHSKLSDFADEIFLLDVRVSQTMIGEEQESGSQGDELQTCHADSVDLEHRFRHGVANLFHYEKGESPQVGAQPSE